VEEQFITHQEAQSAFNLSEKRAPIPQFSAAAINSMNILDKEYQKKEKMCNLTDFF
jgi:hypothetical protein